MAAKADGSGRLRRLGALTFAAALSGCVSLLPRQPAVRLYEFGQATPQAPPSTAGVPVGRGQASLGVILTQVDLPRPARGDALLTLRGDQAAYIADARWLAPAAVLFQDAAQRAFRLRSRGVRLIGRGDSGAASALLRLDLDEFDVRYAPEGGPPAVVVSLRATLARADGGALLQRDVMVRRVAAEDRVSAIVAAYDDAVSQVLAQTVDWTNAEVPRLASDPYPAADPAPPLADPRSPSLADPSVPHD